MNEKLGQIKEYLGEYPMNTPIASALLRALEMLEAQAKWDESEGYAYAYDDLKEICDMFDFTDIL